MYKPIKSVISEINNFDRKGIFKDLLNDGKILEASNKGILTVELDGKWGRIFIKK